MPTSATSGHDKVLNVGCVFFGFSLHHLFIHINAFGRPSALQCWRAPIGAFWVLGVLLYRSEVGRWSWLCGELFVHWNGSRLPDHHLHQSPTYFIEKEPKNGFVRNIKKENEVERGWVVKLVESDYQCLDHRHGWGTSSLSLPRHFERDRSHVLLLPLPGDANTLCIYIYITRLYFLSLRLCGPLHRVCVYANVVSLHFLCRIAQRPTSALNCCSNPLKSFICNPINKAEGRSDNRL